MSETIRLGHRLEFFDKSGTTNKRFQNWHVNDNADGYVFLPFGFSGVTISLDGDNINATLILPVDGMARSWAQQAIDEQWMAKVEVSMFTDSPSDTPDILYEYFGQVSEAGWDSTSIQLELNTVLDAVAMDIPRRQLQQKLVGRLPTTGSIALR